MMTTRRQIPNTMCSCSGEYINDFKIANEFNIYFHLVYIASSTYELSLQTPQNFVIISIKEFKLSLRKIKNSTSRGPREVPINFLKNLDKAILNTLLIIYDQILKYNYILI